MSVSEQSGTDLSITTRAPQLLEVGGVVSRPAQRAPVVPWLKPAPAPQPAAKGPREAMAAYVRYAGIADLLAGALGATVAVIIRFGTTPGGYLLLPALLASSWIVVLWVYRGYERRFIGEGPDEYLRIVRAGLVLFTCVAVYTYLVKGDFSRTIAMTSVPVAVLASLLDRRLLRTWLHRQRARGIGLHRTIVVGDTNAAIDLIDSLRRTERSYHHGLLPVGLCIPDEHEITPSHVHGVPVLGTLESVLPAIDVTGADLVAVVSHPDLTGHPLRRLSWALEERGVELVVSPGIVEVAGPRLSIRPVAGLSLLHLERPVFSGTTRIMKRAFDLTVATSLVLALSPLLLAIAVVVRATSSGPALFRQTRVSTNGRHFTVYKFRSMVTDAEAKLSGLSGRSEGNGVLFKMRTDPRVTKVGTLLRKYSLDELPQLLNVLIGNMSLVGPRPPLPQEVANYSRDAVRRLRVKPGMTGLWQVSGRSDLTWEESLRLDLRYVDNWSLVLDLSILWRTVRAVLQGSGAY